MTFGFIAAKKAEHSIKTMCRVLEVSRSGYYAWAGRERSPRVREDKRVTVRIRELLRFAARCMARRGPGLTWSTTTASGSPASASSG